ncbi:MAG: hypothetical protein HGB31_09360 [Erysipelotrichaceae bacterium]|nr:hypothetical protein [Erysipelotrichaceae bacterium]
MKGIMMAFGIFVLSMGVTCGLMYYVSFENLRQDTIFSLKQSLSETMVQLDELSPTLRSEKALEFFINNFTLRKKSRVSYKVDLMGFLSDPLALRIKVTAQDTGSLFDLEISTEETMIEVEE